MKLASLISLAAVALAFGACAVSTTPVDNNYPTVDGGGTKDGSGNNNDSASPGKDSSSPDTSVTNQGDSSVINDGTCAGMSTKSMCETCCTGLHKTGYGVYTKALSGCACTGMAVCATQCASEFCMGKSPTPSDACATCLSSSVAPMAACYNDVSMACLGDADCTALYQTCIPPCESK